VLGRQAVRKADEVRRRPKLLCYARSSNNMTKRKLIYFVIIVLALVHQDFWLWDDPTLLFGFLPVGLAYHAFYSLVAVLVWLLALKYAWPADIEAFAEGDSEQPETSAE
jgi:hypothetical protein